MKISKAEFVKSASDPAQCPAPALPEFAFIGRSNVGKSSLINALVNRNGLALISSKPGKTRLINHFIINDTWYLVDLPGYGYAKVSKTMREQWDKMIQNYFRTRENLHCLFVLIDGRIPFQRIDLEMMNWLGQHQVPFVIVYTKIDKVKQNELSVNVKSLKMSMKQYWKHLPPILFTSSETKVGIEELRNYIDECMSMDVG